MDAKTDTAKISRSDRRVAAILAAATQVFLRSGYANTTVDDIVQQAGGSKATVYKHFKTKRDLFSAVVDSVVVRRSQEQLDYDEPDPEKALREFANNRIKVVLSADNIALLRIVIAEAPRFPDIARAYYAHGPGYSHDSVVEFMQIHAKRGTLSIPDADEAAYRFTSLLMHPLYVKRLQLVAKVPTKKERERQVDSAMRAFMKLYGC